MFKDHFSSHATAYAQARPSYPPALFDWLAGQCRQHERVWDAGCGNGQAAVALAGHFQQVIATDPSAEQIAAAVTHPHIDYRVEAAEAPTLEDASIDLVTVAQALHWFDQDRFHAQVRRVARPGALFAAWTYALSTVSPAVDAVYDELYRRRLAGYWPDDRRHVENGYAQLPFPYTRLPVPAFAMVQHWTLAQYLAYLRTWSASQRYLKATGNDAVAAIAQDMAQAWGEADQIRAVSWPLRLHIGRID